MKIYLLSGAARRYHEVMRLHLGRILGIFLIAIGAWSVIREKGLFAVETVKIINTMNDNDRQAWRDLNAQIEAELNTLRGQALWKVSLVDIQKRLSKYPLLKDVTIQKVWPHALEISYSLPPLWAIHQTEDGRFRILADDGRWIGPLKWSRLPGLPWLKGDWVNKKPETKEGVLNLLKQLPKKGPMTAAQISEIQFNDFDGFLLTIVKSGQQIRFGSDNFETKSLRVSQVLEYLQIRGLESRVIDANFSKKVLVRLRNHP